MTNEQHRNNIHSEQSIIILQAFLGKGKTTAIKRIMTKYKRGLFILKYVKKGCDM